MAQRTDRNPANIHHKDGQSHGTARSNVQLCYDLAEAAAPLRKAE